MRNRFQIDVFNVITLLLFMAHVHMDKVVVVSRHPYPRFIVLSLPRRRAARPSGELNL